jgi:hypothetical protein
MLTIKRFLIIAAALIVLPVTATAQTRTGASPGSTEMSVEESYLQESVELMIIREQSRTNSRDMKMVALGYIGEAIERGNKGDDIRSALEFLSLEGVVTVARENGRVINNFPDVRKEAAVYLGKLGTPEAKDTLLKMLNGDNEPMVITEAIRSLGTFEINDSDEVIKTISWTITRFHSLKPDNFMALSAIDTFSKIAAANNGIKDYAVVELLIKIADGPYIPPVRNRARELLKELRQYAINR